MSRSVPSGAEQSTQVVLSCLRRFREAHRTVAQMTLLGTQLGRLTTLESQERAEEERDWAFFFQKKDQQPSRNPIPMK